MTGAVNARSKRQQEKWRFESAVANESTDLLLTLGDRDDAEKKTAASTITKVVSWNDAWVSTFGDYAQTATVKLTSTEAVNKIIVSENGALTNERTVELSNAGILVKGGSLINRGTLKLAAVSTLELENPVGFDNSKGRIETSGKIKINDSGLTEAQQQAPQDIDMGDIRLSGADAMLLSWDKGYTLSTDKDKDKAKRKARVNFGSVELLDGAHFSQSKNALDSGDSMTIGKGAKMDVAGLSTWQTVTLKAADAQIRLMDEGTFTTVDLKAFFTAEAILKKLTVRTRLAFNVTGIDTAELWDTILKVIQGLYLAQRCPVCSFVSFTRRDSGEFEDAPETDLFPCPVGLAFADDTSLAAFAEYMKST